MFTSSSFVIQIQAVHHFSCSFIIKTNKKTKISEKSRDYVLLKGTILNGFPKKTLGFAQIIGQRVKKGSIRNNFTDKANIHIN